MPDILALLDESSEWQALESSLAAGAVPQALLAVLPAEYFAGFRDMYAKRVLCQSLSGDDSCVSCRRWTGEGHPDMIIAGQDDKPPGIEDCMALAGDLSLHPVAAGIRLAVIPSADQLSLPAANSLLKLVEEPPIWGKIIFLSESENLIPTIRSRVWTVRLSRLAQDAVTPGKPPQDPLQWAELMAATAKKDVSELLQEARGWILELAEQGEWGTASELEVAISLALKRRLPVSMVQDMLHAILKEGIKSEQIFGDLREA